MASASAQEKIDEPTGKFFRLPGNTANTPLVKLRAQAIHSKKYALLPVRD
jgi:hypothetical protein